MNNCDSRPVSVYACVCIFVTLVSTLMLCNSALCRPWEQWCLFCRVSVRTFHLSWLLMAGVHASALIRLLWTCRLITEEAEQVITFESLIAQTRRKKNTGQGGSHGRRSHVAYCWVLGTPLSLSVPLSWFRASESDHWLSNTGVRSVRD